MSSPAHPQLHLYKTMRNSTLLHVSPNGRQPPTSGRRQPRCGSTPGHRRQPGAMPDAAPPAPVGARSARLRRAEPVPSGGGSTVTNEPIPPPMEAKDTSTSGMPARVTISSDHQSVLISSGVRSPSTGGSAEPGSGIGGGPGIGIAVSGMPPIFPFTFCTHGYGRPPRAILARDQPDITGDFRRARLSPGKRDASRACGGRRDRW